jgi:hypothetical protein
MQSVWEYAYLKILRKYVDKHHPINEARPRALKHISQYYKRPRYRANYEKPFFQMFYRMKRHEPIVVPSDVRGKRVPKYIKDHIPVRVPRSRQTVMGEYEPKIPEPKPGFLETFFPWLNTLPYKTIYVISQIPHMFVEDTYNFFKKLRWILLNNIRLFFFMRHLRHSKPLKPTKEPIPKDGLLPGRQTSNKDPYPLPGTDNPYGHLVLDNDESSFYFYEPNDSSAFSMLNVIIYNNPFHVKLPHFWSELWFPDAIYTPFREFEVSRIISNTRNTLGALVFQDHIYRKHIKQKFPQTTSIEHYPALCKNMPKLVFIDPQFTTPTYRVPGPFQLEIAGILAMVSLSVLTVFYILSVLRIQILVHALIKHLDERDFLIFRNLLGLDLFAITRYILKFLELFIFYSLIIFTIFFLIKFPFLIRIRYWNYFLAPDKTRSSYLVPAYAHLERFRRMTRKLRKFEYLYSDDARMEAREERFYLTHTGRMNKLRAYDKRFRNRRYPKRYHGRTAGFKHQKQKYLYKRRFRQYLLFRHGKRFHFSDPKFVYNTGSIDPHFFKIYGYTYPQMTWLQNINNLARRNDFNLLHRIGTWDLSQSLPSKKFISSFPNFHVSNNNFSFETPISNNLVNFIRNRPKAPKIFHRVLSRTPSKRHDNFTRVFASAPQSDELNNGKDMSKKGVSGLWGTILSEFYIYLYSLGLIRKHIIKTVSDKVKSSYNIPALAQALGLFFTSWSGKPSSGKRKPGLLIDHQRSWADVLYDATWFFPGFVPSFVIMLFDLFTFHIFYLIALFSLALMMLLIPTLQVYPSAFVITRYKVRNWLTYRENVEREKKRLPRIPYKKIP